MNCHWCKDHNIHVPPHKLERCRDPINPYAIYHKCRWCHIEQHNPYALLHATGKCQDPTNPYKDQVPQCYFCGCDIEMDNGCREHEDYLGQQNINSHCYGCCQLDKKLKK